MHLRVFTITNVLALVINSKQVEYRLEHMEHNFVEYHNYKGVMGDELVELKVFDKYFVIYWERYDEIAMDYK